MGKHRDSLFVQALRGEDSFDPVKYLEVYSMRLARTEGGEEDEASAPLWVSTRKQHNPDKSVTLATWLKRAMKGGGLDTEKFKAHSIRSVPPAHLRKKKSPNLIKFYESFVCF